MVTAKLPPCKVCSTKNAAKYRCPIDGVDYCSVPCFKKHKAEGCLKEGAYEPPPPLPLLKRESSPEAHTGEERRPRKRLKDLRWPPEPDPALWDNPLYRDDIKPLRGFELEALAESPELRQALSQSSTLISTLSRISDLPRYRQETDLRTLLSLPPQLASTQYRPTTSQPFSSSSQVPSLNGQHNSTKGHHQTRGNRGSKRSLYRGVNNGNWASRGDGSSSTNEVALLAPNVEERNDTEQFVDEVSKILNQVREARGEMG